MKKKQFREASIKRLRKVMGMGSYVKDKHMNSLLCQLIVKEGIHSVMCYLPLTMEVNIYPLIKQLRMQQKKVYVPFMEGKSFRLVKYRLPLRTKKFGIKEPYDSKQYRNKKIDLAIVPIVGVDTTFRRIGFGKGMYDRFFVKEHINIDKVIFVARELCYSKEIVTDHYDVKADQIIIP